MLGMSQFLIKVVGDDNDEAALSADDSVEGWWLDVLQVLCSALFAWTLFHVSLCGRLLDLFCIFQNQIFIPVILLNIQRN